MKSNEFIATRKEVEANIKATEDKMTDKGIRISNLNYEISLLEDKIRNENIIASEGWETRANELEAKKKELIDEKTRLEAEASVMDLTNKMLTRTDGEILN